MIACFYLFSPNIKMHNSIGKKTYLFVTMLWFHLRFERIRSTRIDLKVLPWCHLSFVSLWSFKNVFNRTECQSESRCKQVCVFLALLRMFLVFKSCIRMLMFRGRIRNQWDHSYVTFEWYLRMPAAFYVLLFIIIIALIYNTTYLSPAKINCSWWKRVILA